MKTYKLGVATLLLAILVACGTPALKSNTGHGAATEGAGGHSTSPATVAAGARGTAAATQAAGIPGTSPATRSAATQAATRAVGTSPATLAATQAATRPVAAANTVRGQVTYRERIALPADAVLTVQIQDVSKADASAVILAEQKIAIEGKAPPYAFSVPYDASKVDPKAIYAVSVKIEQGSKLLYINTTRVPVITNAAGFDAGVIVLTKVG
jgi:putative lipoprotein